MTVSVAANAAHAAGEQRHGDDGATESNAANNTATDSTVIGLATPPVIITTNPLAGGVLGTTYTQTLQASGGVPPYVNWIVTGGTPPPGLTLIPGTGVLTGIPTAAGIFTFTVQVTDAQPVNATKVFTVTIGSAPGPGTSIPTLGGLGLTLLALFLGFFGMRSSMRRRHD